MQQLPHSPTLSRMLFKFFAENRTIVQYLPYVTRWGYLATMFTEAITVNAPEFLENIQIPQS
jgi:NADH:ubiquinone oxidoreductase subunit D